MCQDEVFDGIPDEKHVFFLFDEASMYGTVHLGQFFKECLATPLNFKFCFMGDVGQINPWDAGIPFRDMIDSECIPTKALTRNYRAKAKIIQEFSTLYRKKTYHI